MSDPIQHYDFPEAWYGNSYDDVVFRLPEIPANSLADAKIYMQLRKRASALVVAEYSTINSKIEIRSNFIFAIKRHNVAITADTYLVDILIIFADGWRQTFLEGKWIIHTVITTKKFTEAFDPSGTGAREVDVTVSRGSSLALNPPVFVVIPADDYDYDTLQKTPPRFISVFTSDGMPLNYKRMAPVTEDDNYFITIPGTGTEQTVEINFI